mmetsp:Transcript_108283/g.221068  ORF Transcript_108283/g.221068 Transcript_108283/m.221068 type:complete len:94 (-) Transcript_108283:109-390(-)
MTSAPARKRFSLHFTVTDNTLTDTADTVADTIFSLLITVNNKNHHQQLTSSPTTRLTSTLTQTDDWQRRQQPTSSPTGTDINNTNQHILPQFY